MRRWILKKIENGGCCLTGRSLPELELSEIEPMKPRSILPLLLATGLLTPLLQAQDVPAKIREIEKKVLLEQYQKAIQALIGSARELQSGATGNAADILGKRLQWFTAVDGQLGGADKVAAAKGQDMSKSAGTLNDLAWNMVTSPDLGARKPEIALKLADIAIELGGENVALKPKVLDTRARALFLLGKRNEAIAGQVQAIAAATIEAEKAGFEGTLAAYQKGELPEISAPAAEREASATEEVVLAAKNLRSRIDEVVALQNRLENAAKENSGVAGTDIAQLKEELKKRKEELEKLTQMPDLENARSGSTGVAYLMGKLRTIVIPSVSFKDTTLEEAVDFLRKRSIELDTTELDPARKGLNILVRRAAEKPGAASGKETVKPADIRIKELQLRNVPLAEVLRYICEVTRMRYKVDDFAVTLIDPNEPEDLFNRTFRVPPDFGSSLVPIQDLLKLCGVKFGEEASATLISPDMLVVKNTPTEIDKIEQLIEAVIIARASREKLNPLAPDQVAPVPVNPGE